MGAAAALLFLVYLNNTSRFATVMTGSPTVLVHRGIAQQVDWDTADENGCIADQTFPPKHEYLENTIASMRAAFDRGANVVEFDIHRTRDNRFAVFHDRRLECRTDGQGAPHDHSLEELQALDVGYGWTGMVPDSCETAPLFVPVNIAPWLWGWPNLFMERMRSSGSSIVVVGAFNGGNFTRGLDNVEDLSRLPGNFDGGIWTNDLELVISTLRKTSDRKQDSSLH